MDVFLVVFALAFVIGFAVRGIYRATMTTRCPHCREQVDKSATVCRSCGREVAA